MPQLGADNSGNGRNRNNADRIGVDVPALEIRVESPARAHCGQPEHDAEGANRKASNMDVGIHEGTTTSSIREAPIGAATNGCVRPQPQGRFLQSAKSCSKSARSAPSSSPGASPAPDPYR